MAFIESQQNPGIVAEVDPTFRALRTSLRPLEYQSIQGKLLGHYAAFGQTAAIAPAANAVLGLIRWTDPTNFLAAFRIWTCVTVVTAVTAQRTDPLVVTTTRGYTVAETTNATQLAIAGNSQKMRTNMGSSLVPGNPVANNLCVASAAAGMTGGTKTNDQNPFGSAAFGAGPALAALGTGLGNTDLYKVDKPYQHPEILTQQEGILLLWGPTALATGTVTVGWGIEWGEVPAF